MYGRVACIVVYVHKHNKINDTWRNTFTRKSDMADHKRIRDIFPGFAHLRAKSCDHVDGT